MLTILTVNDEVNGLLCAATSVLDGAGKQIPNVQSIDLNTFEYTANLYTYTEGTPVDIPGALSYTPRIRAAVGSCTGVASRIVVDMDERSLRFFDALPDRVEVIPGFGSGASNEL